VWCMLKTRQCEVFVIKCFIFSFFLPVPAFQYHLPFPFVFCNVSVIFCCSILLNVCLFECWKFSRECDLNLHDFHNLITNLLLNTFGQQQFYLKKWQKVSVPCKNFRLNFKCLCIVFIRSRASNETNYVWCRWLYRMALFLRRLKDKESDDENFKKNENCLISILLFHCVLA